MWDPTPTQEIVLIGCLGLGLGLGFRAGAGLGLPLSALLRGAARGLGWGLLLRALAPLRQLLIAAAVAGGGPGVGMGVVGALALLALTLGLRDLRTFRCSTVRAALEAAALPSPRGGSLAPLAEALLNTIGATALGLCLGLGAGLGCPGPDALALHWLSRYAGCTQLLAPI